MTAVTVRFEAMEHYDQSLGLPGYQTTHSAGADIIACLYEKHDITILPGQRVLIPTGLKVAIPQGFEGQVRPRSGLSLKTSLMVVNSPGTIDSDYRGELKILMGNLGAEPVVVSHGDRVAQLVINPVVQARFELVEQLDQTLRGEGGFGSTGVRVDH